MKTEPAFFKTGHRGCRGLYPENTLIGFREAIRLGVNCLELDIVVSKDMQLVISHEPYMHPDFCLKPDGQQILEAELHSFNLYKMMYEEIKTFDCGSKLHPRFPAQKKSKEYKPLLSELIQALPSYDKEFQVENILLDIEIKSEPAEYGISQPSPEIFVQLILDLIKDHSLEDQILLRSFDPKPLQLIHSSNPTIPLALIVENNLSAKKNIEQLGFVPYMYSPDYTLLTKSERAYLHSLDLKVVPWTVNSKEAIKEMLQLEVDGIITDFPNLFKTMGL